MATIVEGDPKAPFSIATTPSCKGRRYSFPWIAPLYPWSLQLENFYLKLIGKVIKLLQEIKSTLNVTQTMVSVCPTCKVQLTTKHFLLNCNNFKHIRTKYYQARNLRDSFKNTNPENIFNFLKKKQLFQQDITKHLHRTATLMAEIQNNLFGIKWPTGVDMPLNKTQTQTMFCSQSVISKIWHKFKRNEIIMKGKHISKPWKTSKPQDKTLKASYISCK